MSKINFDFVNVELDEKYEFLSYFGIDSNKMKITIIYLYKLLIYKNEYNKYVIRGKYTCTIYII